LECWKLYNNGWNLSDSADKQHWHCLHYLNNMFSKGDGDVSDQTLTPLTPIQIQINMKGTFHAGIQGKG